MNINKEEILKHIDSVIGVVKENAKIVFSTKDENTMHYDIIKISHYSFILKREKKLLVNNYDIIIEKNDVIVIQKSLPFFIGKIIFDKIKNTEVSKIDKTYVLDLLNKARSYFSGDKNDDVIDINDLSKFK